MDNDKNRGLLDPLRESPDRSALLLDVDGVLAPIVPTPAQARVPDPTRDLLAALAGQFLLVACVSGRRALDARRVVGIDSLAYSGNHGIEYLAPGAPEADVDPATKLIAQRVAAFSREQFTSQLRDAGVRLEDKQSIFAFHWRGAGDEAIAQALLEKVAEEARAAGLVPHRGRKVLEIRPDIPLDKGTAIAALVERAKPDNALYAGDDATDLDAFSRLRELESEGRLARAIRIAIASPESPEQIVRAADLAVASPEQFAKLLESLLRAR